MTDTTEAEKAIEPFEGVVFRVIEKGSGFALYAQVSPVCSTRDEAEEYLHEWAKSFIEMMKGSGGQWCAQ
jgi:hypothetical protein